jgi:rubrerythrin
MTLDEAIKTALTYETRIRDLYREAAEAAEDPTGRNLFRLLAEDEQRHVDYLDSRLLQWERTGDIALDAVAEAIPSPRALKEGLAPVEASLAADDRKVEKQMLSKALAAEVETSEFYRRMVDTLSGEGQKLFARFLEIENEHIEIVQAELDYLSGSGYWFDQKEFDME